MKTIENATFAGFLIRFRPTSDLLTKEFSKYYFRSDKHRLFFVKEMNLVTRASLSQELLKRLPVLLPPIKEQLTIADYLEQKCSGIDEAINKKFEVIEKLIKYLKDLGLTGLETHHSSQPKEMQEKLSEIAKKYNLEESYGSDFHGENVKPGLKIGDIVKK